MYRFSHAFVKIFSVHFQFVQDHTITNQSSVIERSRSHEIEIYFNYSLLQTPAILVRIHLIEKYSNVF